MNVEQAINDISSLSASEQIQVVSAIWDNLPDDVIWPDIGNEKAILKHRLAKFKIIPTTSFPKKHLKQKLRETTGKMKTKATARRKNGRHRSD